MGFKCIRTALLLSALVGETADADGMADRAAARQLAIDGIRLADAGRCDQALEKLMRAEKIHPAPTIRERIGECQIALGKVLAGVESLLSVLREPLSSNSPAAFFKAKERAQTAYEEASQKLGQIVVTVRAPEGVRYSVTLDQEPLSWLLIGSPRPIEPGEHNVEVRAEGFYTAANRFVVHPGEELPVELVLKSTGPSFSVSLTPHTALHPETAEKSNGEGDRSSPVEPWRTMAYGAWAVGALGLGTGIALGLVALDKRTDAESSCPGKICPPDAHDRLDSARAFANGSTVGFAFGIAGAASGTFFFLLSNRSERATPTPSVQARPWIGPTGAGVYGAF